MMTSTIRKFGVGVASLALVASMAGPAFAKQLQEVPGPMDGMVQTGRLGGFDRIETAIKIAEKAFAKKNADVVVAYIAGAADTAAVDSAAAGHLSDGPLYLVGGDNRSQKAVSDSINDHYPNVQKIIAIGGTKAVSDASLKGIADEIAAKTERLAGADRYGTAAAIAEYGMTRKNDSDGIQFVNPITGRVQPSKVYLARGDNPVDALVSGTLDDAPVLLLGPDGSIPEATAAYLKKHLPSHFVALGGENAVPTTAFKNADYDPVMKNIWLNNEEIKDAQDAVNKWEILLNGVYKGAEGLNPSQLADGKEISTADEAIIKAQITAIEIKLGNEDGTQPNTLYKALKDAKDTAVGANANAEKAAYDAADKAYMGKGQKTSPTASDGDFMGSKNMAENADKASSALKARDDAQKALNGTKENKAYVEKAVKEIGDAVTAFEAGKAAADNQPKKIALTKALKDVVEKYISHYAASPSAKAVSAIQTSADNTTDADAFADLWKDSSHGGLKGLSTTADQDTGLETSGSVAQDNKSYAPKAALKNAIDDMDVDAKQAALETKQRELAGWVAQAANEKATYDRTKKAYEDKIADLTKNSQAVKDAQAAVEYAKAQLDSLRLKLNAGNDKAFMGYAKIAEKYSSIDGVYSNARNEYVGVINRQVSELVNAERATPAGVVGNNILTNAVNKAYGITLNADNVEKFFAFKTVDGVKQAVRANHKRMQDESNAVVAKAEELVNDFYAKMAAGFNVGDMHSWFSYSGNFRSSVTNYGSLTKDQRDLVDDAARAVVDAVFTGARTWGSYSAPATTTADAYTINQHGFEAAYRVAHYLMGIAKNNKENAAANLAKAKLALQAALDKVTPKRYDRIEGSDRYQTSAAIAGYWRAAYVPEGGLSGEMDTLDVYVANGISYIDAVAGGQLMNGPIVLVAPDGKLTDAVKQRFAFAKTDTKVLTITALGGTKVVADSVLVDAKNAAFDKSLLKKDFFTSATNKAVDNAKDKADEKK